MLSMVGHSATTPLLPLTALDLGSSVAEAALVTALLGLGTFLGALPAGYLADRFGEKRVLVGAALVDAVLILMAALAPNVAVLYLVAVVLGVTAAVFGLARQGYLTHAVPIGCRARAMSTLGGVFRIGSFVGPLLGAAVIAAWELRAAYVLATVTSLLAGAVTLALPSLPGGPQTGAAASEPARMGAVLRAHLRTYLTVGLGAAALTLVRTARDALLPLWSNSSGLDAAQTSLVFGASAGVDMLLFYLGGSLMDRHGRRAVALPAMLVMGTGLALLPLAHGIGAILAIAVLLGLGNGISAGVVLTLGSDHAPRVGLPQFLAGWRLTTMGIGSTAGPLLISGITAVAPLAVACVAMGAVGWLGAAWLWRWTAPPPRAG
nr:MFS transporter [Propionibacterium sp.]